MSKLMNPETEASITCGFYNGLSTDKYRRRYNSEQMSEIFDGIINDGIFMNIGDKLMPIASSGNTVTIGSGKCWFNSTWTKNDAPFVIDCGESNSVLNRIDVIVVEVDKSESVRDNTIKVIQGTPATNPVRPTLSKGENNIYQYALCEIERPTGSVEISFSQVTNLVGSETPFITGILETVNTAELVTQWQAQWDEYFAQKQTDIDTDLGVFQAETEAALDDWIQRLSFFLEEAASDTVEWIDNEKTTILDWFEGIKGKLTEDVAANFQLQLDEAEIKNILAYGFADGTKRFSDDGLVITATDSSGRTLTKSFNSDFSTCTITLQSKAGSEIGRLIKHFSADGNTVTSDLTTR